MNFQASLKKPAALGLLGLSALAGLLVPPAARASGPAFSLAGPAASGPRPPAFSLAGGEAGEDAPAPADAAPASVMPKMTRRALLELGVVAVYSTIRYWADYHRWVEDWQYELTCEDQYRRFLTTEAIRFDSNNYVTNWTHVIAGAFYYQMARTNYLTWKESLLAAFVSSLTYEYVSEWREVISINDMFMTSFGAISVGEAWFQLSDVFHHSRSPFRRVLAFMNPVNEINHFLDRRKPASRLFDEPGWHGFTLSTGWRHSSETGRPSFDAGWIGVETEMLRIPGYGRPGAFRKVLKDTSLSELAIDVALRRRRPEDGHLRGGLSEEVDLYARVVPMAWYRQDVDDAGRGYALSIGLGSAFSYVRKRPTLYDATNVAVHIDPLPGTPTDFRDKMSVTHLVGPVVDWTRFGRGFKLRLVADAYVDFAMMTAYAFNAYSAVHSIEGMKTTLGYFGYHYALGASASGRVDLEWGHFWVRGQASAHTYGSWENRDRFQSELTNDAHAADSRTRLLLKAGWRLPSVPLRVFGAVEAIHRQGRIGDVRASGNETRTFAGLSYFF